ncbi:GNAT family N-acetyltransferase [Roseicyclus marinus]|uniref:GNAT family N-acetyltransferase n=1 Tax=Roseicyclus marinus TaxID=2161673 RepID=UPI00241069B0|nr:GNAT family N-acetyltransferase [Roseicyclus marinus]MDG3040202.1 GNAT family N-acetyltransferase [Roseicyclus marinus]
MTVSNVETNPGDFNDFTALHALLSTAFAYMADRIDPPSSMTRLSLADLRAKSTTEDLFLIRENGTPIACLFGAAAPDHYYIGKLAVAAAQRGQGHARALVEAAARHARALSLPALVLQSRVELVENHAAFAAMGFVVTAKTAHPGYDRPTSLTFRRAL